ncbi:MAG TPA: hypothetical protein VF581_10555 [Flavobacterium sp.]|jgi:PBP1b-binding outer membrane lipoprotein LpoB
MKNYFLILCAVLLLTGCKSKSKVAEAAEIPEASEFSVVDPTEVNAAQKKKAYELGKRVLMTCNTSRFKPFTASEATEKVIQNTTQERLTKTCHTFRLKYGDFKDLQLVEVLRPKDNSSTIYRYKALYEKKIANKELRVTMDSANKISALKSTDWVEEFKPL